MPHQCTSCGRQFADGSKEMLSGCPDCGGTKFQFMPDGGAPAAAEPPDPPTSGTGTVTETVGHVATKLRDFVGDDPTPPKRATRGDGGTATAAATPSAADQADPTGPDAGGVGDEGDTDSDLEEGDGERDETPGPEDESLEPEDQAPAGEDTAQSTARSQMVSPGELPDGSACVGTGGDVQEVVDTDAEPEGRVVDTPSDDAPDLAELREELNDQFEGIRICEPGQYELNLMELYEREETIIALQENGRYVIEPPESWRGDGGP